MQEGIRISREASREQTRERLRASAMRSFAREGIGGSSIDRITESAGYSRGAFYSNYADKHELALDLLAAGQRAEIQFWTGMVAGDVAIEELFTWMRDRFNSFWLASDWGLLNVELQLEAERNPAFGVAHERYLADLHIEATSLLHSLFIRFGRTPPENIRLVARTLRALTMALVIQGHGEGADPGAMLVIFFRGILATIDGEADPTEES